MRNPAAAVQTVRRWQHQQQHKRQQRLRRALMATGSNNRPRRGVQHAAGSSNMSADGPQIRVTRTARIERLATACSECRRRKQRCDQKQPCGNCARRFPVPACEYRPRRPRPQPGPSQPHQEPSYLVFLPTPHLPPLALSSPNETKSLRPLGSLPQESPWSSAAAQRDTPPQRHASADILARWPDANESASSYAGAPAMSAATQQLGPLGPQLMDQSTMMTLNGFSWPMDPVSLAPAGLVICQAGCTEHSEEYHEQAREALRSMQSMPDDLIFFDDNSVPDELLAGPSALSGGVLQFAAPVQTLGPPMQAEDNDEGTTTLRLIVDEWCLGKTNDLQDHFTRIWEIARQRESLGGLGLGDALDKQARFYDLVIALSLERQPYLDREAEWDILEAYLPGDVSLNTPLLASPVKKPGPFTTSAASLGLHPSAAQILDEMQYLLHLVLQLPDDPSTQQLQKVQQTIIFTHDRLLQMPEFAPSSSIPGAAKKRGTKRRRPSASSTPDTPASSTSVGPMYTSSESLSQSAAAGGVPVKRERSAGSPPTPMSRRTSAASLTGSIHAYSQGSLEVPASGQLQQPRRKSTPTVSTLTPISPPQGDAPFPPPSSYRRMSYNQSYPQAAGVATSPALPTVPVLPSSSFTFTSPPLVSASTGQVLHPGFLPLAPPPPPPSMGPATLPSSSSHSTRAPQQSDALYAAVRLAALVYCRGIRTRRPLSQACGPHDVDTLCAALARVAPAAWSHAPGVLAWVAMAAAPAAMATAGGDDEDEDDEGRGEGEGEEESGGRNPAAADQVGSSGDRERGSGGRRHSHRQQRRQQRHEQQQPQSARRAARRFVNRLLADAARQMAERDGVLADAALRAGLRLQEWLAGGLASSIPSSSSLSQEPSSAKGKEQQQLGRPTSAAAVMLHATPPATSQGRRAASFDVNAHALAAAAAAAASGGRNSRRGSAVSVASGKRSPAAASVAGFPAPRPIPPEHPQHPQHQFILQQQQQQLLQGYLHPHQAQLHQQQQRRRSSLSPHAFATAQGGTPPLPPHWGGTAGFGPTQEQEE